MTILINNDLKARLLIKELSKTFQINGYETDIQKFIKRVNYSNPKQLLIDTNGFDLQDIFKLLIKFNHKDITLIMNETYPEYAYPLFIRIGVRKIIYNPSINTLKTLLKQSFTPLLPYKDISKILNLPQYLQSITFPAGFYSPRAFNRYIRQKRNQPTKMTRKEKEIINKLVKMGVFPSNIDNFSARYRRKIPSIHIKAQSALDK